MKLNELGPLLENPWGEQLEPTRCVIGVWPEDGRRYEINGPPQLISLLVEIQNKLHRKYKNIQNLESELSTAYAEFEKLLVEK